MLTSLRNIANALLVAAVLSFSMSFLSLLSFSCGNGGTDCVAAVFSVLPHESSYSAANVAISQSTDSYRTDSLLPISLAGFVQVVSGYALLVAVLILLALECVELHYIRRLFRQKSFFRFGR